MSSIDVSVVLPVYNEMGHLEEELDRIHAGFEGSGLTYELVVIDDASTDGSGELLEKRDDIELTRMPVNRGSGHARRVGTRSARGDVVVWTDVDMTYPNDTIPDLVGKLSGHDQIVGARTTEEGTLKLLRRPTKWFLKLIAQILAGQKIPDLNSGFRAFRRDVGLQFLHLLPEGFSCVTTLTLSFMSNGYTVGYTEIPYATRAGRSKFHWYADTRKYLLQIVRMTLMFNPLRLLGPIGTSLALIGLFKTLYDVITDPVRIAINTVVLLIIASGILLVGFLADLIVQVNKPRNLVLPTAVHTSTSRE